MNPQPDSNADNTSEHRMEHKRLLITPYISYTQVNLPLSFSTAISSTI